VEYSVKIKTVSVYSEKEGLCEVTDWTPKRIDAPDVPGAFREALKRLQSHHEPKWGSIEITGVHGVDIF